MMLERLLRWVKPVRDPDMVLTSGTNQAFLRRWFIIPHNRVFEIFLNNFTSSDPVEDLHDHPSFTISLALKGRYLEHLRGGVVKERHAGNIVARSPWLLHRIEVLPGEESWSIFVTFPKIREWGFMTKRGWVNNNDFFGGEGDI